MKILALLLAAFASLAVAGDDDVLCHLHRTEKECKSSSDGPKYTLDSQTEPARKYAGIAKDKVTSNRVDMPFDDKLKKLSMDTNGCTYKHDGDSKGKELSQFIAIVLFKGTKCGGSDKDPPLARAVGPHLHKTKAGNLVLGPGVYQQAEPLAELRFDSSGGGRAERPFVKR